jgi:hypothetical protein
VTIEVGDLVHLRLHPSTKVGVVMRLYSPERRNVVDGFKPRAKILMFNGRTYDFIVDDLELKAKGKTHDSL